MHPERVGNIRIEKVLGQGGMGTVSLGFDEKLERTVALKSIRNEQRMSESARQRFQFEARVLGKLEHPNICRIHDYIEDGEDAYLVLEYVEGHSLAAHLADHTLEDHHRLTIAIQIADALVAAHAAGVIHRDLKPDNVVITLDGDAKVLDFGLARSVTVEGDGDEPPTHPTQAHSPEGPAHEDLDTASRSAAVRPPTHSLQVTEAGTIMGTPLFMSPEQAWGLTDEITTASDMYSLGLLLQALWTSESPYPKKLSRAELIARARAGEALPPTGMPQQIKQLVLRLREVDPGARVPAVQARHLLRRYQARPARLLRQGAAALLLIMAAAAAVKYTVDLRHQKGLAEEAAREQRRLRGVADLRRELAEGLIGFMLDDLFDKLRSVGKLELLDDVDKRALDYFAAIPEGELSPEELTFRSQTLYQLGEISLERGDLQTALSAFNDSLTLQQTIVSESPDNQTALVQLGYAHFWMGSGLWTQGDLDKARAQFEASADVARRLVALAPENPEYQLELAAEESNVAQVLEAQGDLVTAAQVMRSRLATVQTLVDSDPERDDWQLELANSKVLLGRVLESQGDYAAAEECYRADLQGMLELVGRDPDHAERLDRLSTSYSYLGQILEKQERFDEAALCIEEQQLVSERLASGDADNAGWRDHVASGLSSLGSLRLAAGELEQARIPLSRSLAIFFELHEQDPTRTRWRYGALGLSNLLADLLTQQGEVAGAEEVARRGLALMEGIDVSSLPEVVRTDIESLEALVSDPE